MCRLSTLPAHPTGVYESYANGDKIAYSYNNEGNLTSQTKNSKSAPYVTYEYNSDGESTWYFQYDTNGTPLGFVLNGTQYFYITNQMGDILAITDAEGNIVGNYEYDAWGKVLTADTDIAKQNPLRYRGYYYDNETGLYYLQSRYYSPDLCRFISPDDFEFINNSSTLYLNAYAYCYNNAVSLSDAEGTTPQLAMNVADISAFVKHIGAKVKETAKESLEKAKALLNKTVEKLKEMWAKLEEKRSQAIKDLKYFVENPDVVISQKLSKLLHKEVKVRFRVLEYIRATLHQKRASKYYMLGNLLIDDDCLSKKDKNSESNSTSKAKAKSKITVAESEKTDNWFLAIMKALMIAIEIDTITREFEAIVKTINSTFDLNKWFNALSQKGKDIFSSICLGLSTIINTAWNDNPKSLENFALVFSFDEIIKLLFNNKGLSVFLDGLISITESFSSRDSGKKTTSQAIVSSSIGTIISIICVFLPDNALVVAIATISDFIINSTIDGIFNYQNGHLWG